MALTPFATIATPLCSVPWGFLIIPAIAYPPITLIPITLVMYVRSAVLHVLTMAQPQYAAVAMLHCRELWELPILHATASLITT